jgi:hypothetical protein
LLYTNILPPPVTGDFREFIGDAQRLLTDTMVQLPFVRNAWKDKYRNSPPLSAFCRINEFAQALMDG